LFRFPFIPASHINFFLHPELRLQLPNFIMRSAFAVAALCSLVAAAPRPQMINVNAVKKLPLPSVLGPDIAHPEVTPAAYDPKSAAAAAAAAIPTDPVAVYKRSVIEVRNACEVQPGG
jgi:hypothetical protein